MPARLWYTANAPTAGIVDNQLLPEPGPALSASGALLALAALARARRTA